MTLDQLCDGTMPTAQDIADALKLAPAAGTPASGSVMDLLDAKVSTRSTYAGGAVASVTGAVGSVAAGVALAAAQPNYAPAKAGDKMDLVDAPNAAAVAALQSGLATQANVPTADAIADAVLSRGVANVEDSAPQASLTTLVLAAVNKANTADNAGYLTVYRTDGVTEHARIPIAIDPTAAPIEGLG
jgi:hypothetical protein